MNSDQEEISPLRSQFTMNLNPREPRVLHRCPACNYFLCRCSKESTKPPLTDGQEATLSYIKNILVAVAALMSEDYPRLGRRCDEALDQIKKEFNA